MSEEEIVKQAEEYIARTGDYGLKPVRADERKNLTGLRYVPIIEKKIGRRITDAEWEGMSIR
ncbi:MAG: hypothetical protein LBK54_04445 [Propionibacteriaceae bacterium]|jgi:hypothetical protein|nr:hypothetical protein [Propionibacteriaceae bacterium]